MAHSNASFHVLILSTGESNTSGAVQLLRFYCGVYRSGMLREETWSFANSTVRSHVIGMKNWKHHTNPESTTRPIQFEHALVSKLVAEWQQRGPETLSGLAIRKVRFSFAPTQSVLIASAGT